jgi:hypothetical protein
MEPTSPTPPTESNSTQQPPVVNVTVEAPRAPDPSLYEPQGIEVDPFDPLTVLTDNEAFPAAQFLAEYEQMRCPEKPEKGQPKGYWRQGQTFIEVRKYAGDSMTTDWNGDPNHIDWVPARGFTRLFHPLPADELVERLQEVYGNGGEFQVRFYRSGHNKAKPLGDPVFFSIEPSEDPAVRRETALKEELDRRTHEQRQLQDKMEDLRHEMQVAKDTHQDQLFGFLKMQLEEARAKEERLERRRLELEEEKQEREREALETLQQQIEEQEEERERSRNEQWQMFSQMNQQAQSSTNAMLQALSESRRGGDDGGELLKIMMAFMSMTQQQSQQQSQQQQQMLMTMMQMMNQDKKGDNVTESPFFQMMQQQNQMFMQHMMSQASSKGSSIGQVAGELLKLRELEQKLTGNAPPEAQRFSGNGTSGQADHSDVEVGNAAALGGAVPLQLEAPRVPPPAHALRGQPQPQSLPAPQPAQYTPPPQAQPQTQPQRRPEPAPIHEPKPSVQRSQPAPEPPPKEEKPKVFNPALINMFASGIVKKAEAAVAGGTSPSEFYEENKDHDQVAILKEVEPAELPKIVKQLKSAGPALKSTKGEQWLMQLGRIIHNN